MIVSCGEALVDLAPEPTPGGGPMNVAVAAARLGVPAAFVGRVSTDQYGELIWSHLRANAVDVRACERGPEATARAIVEHVPQLAFRFEGDNTAETQLTGVDLARLGPGPHVLHGGTLGMFRGQTAETLARVVERHEGIVSIDPNVRPSIIDDRTRWDHYHTRWLARAHIYRASDEDFDWIWPDRTLASCAEELLAGSTQIVLATRGRDGVIGYSRSGEFHVAGREIDVVDTVGAGDTFVAAVLASLWELGLRSAGHEIERLTVDDWRAIGQRAVRAAAVTCSRRGADPPRTDELPA